MHPCVFIIFSLLILLLRESTTANQLVAVGNGEDSNGVMNKCVDKERRALLHFKALLEDPDDSLSTWRAKEDDCCTWSGVACDDQTGHVTRLDIGNYNIGGEISHSLVNLSYLTFLDLSFNYLHGTIPTSIGSITQLRYLNLCYNNLNGTIPKSIGSLIELRILSLSNNSLYGTIPPQFGNLTNLKQLDLGSVGRCRVEDLEWVSPLSHLEWLDMAGISLAKANHWVNVISSLQNLSYLSLEGCELSQIMYPYSSSFLNSSPSLYTLNLGDNNLTSSIYRWLFQLTSNKLFYLDLSRNMLDAIPKYIGNLCSLESLTLYKNSAVVNFPDFLKNLSGCASLTLQDLDAGRSGFTGSLSDEIHKFSSLASLKLDDNQLNGTISDQLWELPRLNTLDLSYNYLKGSISEKIGKSKAITINLSKNSLEGVSSTNHISNLSYVEAIDLSSCKIGPRFPQWIQTLKNLSYLDFSNNTISDTVPLEFWETWPSQLLYLNLSSNNISGMIPDLSSNFDFMAGIDLSSNSFYGPIPNVSSTLKLLDLSRNRFNGEISFLCQIVDGLLEFLDLSDNLLSGQLPDCLWHFKQLTVLNLGNNCLSGNLPPSIGSLIKLEALHLYNNNFSGELPFSLNNCTKLKLLNLWKNKFFGNVPVWIGENLSELYVLILRSNSFFGTIPLQLCQLANLQILDLSRNHLHGIIPLCFNNLTRMVQEGFIPTENEHFFSVTLYWHGSMSYFDHAAVGWQGDEREFFRNLRLLKSIDLSSNNLTGKIPHEIANLYELIALNVSRNTLLGEIPWNIGQMGKLLTLDLSRNSFSGGLPSSMSQMSLLNDLDVSFNNLSGRIPSSTQLQSFEPSRYDGNAGLCGPPLTKYCPGDEESEAPSAIDKSEGDGEGMDELQRWFYIGGGTGFATGFWIACGALLLNSRGRYAFFHFYDSFNDWVNPKVVLIVANLQKIAHM